MKIFLFSKRFLLPLFIIWILLLGYLTWSFWSLWSDDFEGKGLSSQVIFEFMLSHLGGPAMIMIFTSAFLLAIIFYSHFKVRKERFISLNFFSAWNLLAVFLISLVTFLYTAYIEPNNATKSQALLAEIVWAKPGNNFNYDSIKLNIKNRGSEFKLPFSMNIKELFNARDSLRSLKDDENKISFPYYQRDNSQLAKIEYIIAKKISWPFVVILFYFFGIFWGASFYKINVIVPLLLGYFVFLTGWYYVQRVFEWLYKREDVNVFLGVNGATILFSFITIAWFFVLKNYSLFIPKETVDLLKVE